MYDLATSSKRKVNDLKIEQDADTKEDLTFSPRLLTKKYNESILQGERFDVSVYERLYNPTYHAEREAKLEELREELALKGCTFSPTLITMNRSSPVRRSLVPPTPRSSMISDEASLRKLRSEHEMSIPIEQSISFQPDVKYTTGHESELSIKSHDLPPKKSLNTDMAVPPTPRSSLAIPDSNLNTMELPLDTDDILINDSEFSSAHQSLSLNDEMEGIDDLIQKEMKEINLLEDKVNNVIQEAVSIDACRDKIVDEGLVGERKNSSLSNAEGENDCKRVEDNNTRKQDNIDDYASKVLSIENNLSEEIKKVEMEIFDGSHNLQKHSHQMMERNNPHSQNEFLEWHEENDIVYQKSKEEYVFQPCEGGSEITEENILKVREGVDKFGTGARQAL